MAGWRRFSRATASRGGRRERGWLKRRGFMIHSVCRVRSCAHRAALHASQIPKRDPPAASRPPPLARGDAACGLTGTYAPLCRFTAWRDSARSEAESLQKKHPDEISGCHPQAGRTIQHAQDGSSAEERESATPDQKNRIAPTANVSIFVVGALAALISSRISSPVRVTYLFRL